MPDEDVELALAVPAFAVDPAEAFCHYSHPLALRGRRYVGRLDLPLNVNHVQGPALRAGRKNHLLLVGFQMLTSIATRTCLFVPCFLPSLLWLGGSLGRVLGEDVVEPVQTVGSVPSLHGLLDVVPAETEARCGGCRQAELLVILNPAEALQLGQPELEAGSPF